jgi:hypothetical protein
MKLMNLGDKPTLVLAVDMQENQVGVIQDSYEEYNGHVVLRVYEGLISLTDASSVWRNRTKYDFPNFTVKLFPPKTLLTFQVEV